MKPPADRQLLLPAPPARPEREGDDLDDEERADGRPPAPTRRLQRDGTAASSPWVRNTGDGALEN